MQDGPKSRGLSTSGVLGAFFPLAFEEINQSVSYFHGLLKSSIVRLKLD